MNRSPLINPMIIPEEAGQEKDIIFTGMPPDFDFNNQ
jgi:hypothetical protein